MACVSLMPCADLTHSQYLWPSAAVELRTLAANASARAEYKAQLQRQYESSQAFQRQFAIFVAQLVHYQQRLDNPFNNGALLYPSPLSHFSPASTARPVPDIPLNTRYRYHHRQSAFLVPPRPRVSSVLSPAPRDTPLPGPVRRPMPRHRAQAAQELLKQALLNCTHGRAAPCADRMEGDDKLGQSWVVVPREDWEVVSTDTSP